MPRDNGAHIVRLFAGLEPRPTGTNVNPLDADAEMETFK